MGEWGGRDISTKKLEPWRDDNDIVTFLWVSMKLFLGDLRSEGRFLQTDVDKYWDFPISHTIRHKGNVGNGDYFI